MEFQHLLTIMPSDVLNGVVSSYCDMKTIGTLDCACCNSTLRPQLFEMYRSDSFVVSKWPVVAKENENERMHWLLSRGVKVSEVQFPLRCHADLALTYFNIFLPTIRRLVVDHDDLRGGHHAGQLEVFQKLTSYIGNRYDIDQCEGRFFIILANNPGLERAYFVGNFMVRTFPTNRRARDASSANDGDDYDNNMEEDEYTWEPMWASHGTQLDKMQLPHLALLIFSHVITVDKSLVAFARAAPCLRHLYLSSRRVSGASLDGDVLCKVAGYTPHLLSFGCHRISIGNKDEYLKDVLNLWVHINNLDLSSHVHLTDDVLVEALSCLRDLRRINLCDCPLLTDHTLDFLTANFRATLNVVHLGNVCSTSMKGRSKMSVQGLATFRSSFAQFRTFYFHDELEYLNELQDAHDSTTLLHIRGVPWDRTLDEVPRRYRALQVLDLVSVHRTQSLYMYMNTAAQLAMFIQFCPQLRTILLPTGQHTSRLSQQFPGLLFSTEDEFHLEFDAVPTML